MKHIKMFEYYVQDIMKEPTTLTTRISITVNDYWFAMERLEEILQDLGYQRTKDTGKDVLFVEKLNDVRTYNYGTENEIENEKHFIMPDGWERFVREITKNFEDIEI